jgi:hypothetical protein
MFLVEVDSLEVIRDARKRAIAGAISWADFRGASRDGRLGRTIRAADSLELRVPGRLPRLPQDRRAIRQSCRRRAGN